MQEQRLTEMLESTVEALGFELLCVELSRAKSSTLRLYIDKEGGVGLADCQEVSNQVSGILDVEDPLSGNYNLEVSSPGLDRPLVKPSQFNRFAGQKAKVQLHIAIDRRRKFVGEIVSADDEFVRFTVDGEELEVPHDQIARARLVPQID